MNDPIRPSEFDPKNALAEMRAYCDKNHIDSKRHARILADAQRENETMRAERDALSAILETHMVQLQEWSDADRRGFPCCDADFDDAYDRLRGALANPQTAASVARRRAEQAFIAAYAEHERVLNAGIKGLGNERYWAERDIASMNLRDTWAALAEPGQK